MVYFVSDSREIGLVDDAKAYLDLLPNELYDRYDNPFEQKWSYKKANLGGDDQNPHPLLRLVEWMETSLQGSISRIFGVPTVIDHSRHYCGIFRYGPGDKLDVHVDAGVHPESKLRKRVTALMYIGTPTGDAGGDLEFWNGDDCTLPASAGSPMVWQRDGLVVPHHGLIVLFENDNHAWHGVSYYHGSHPRYVATVSFLADRQYDNGKVSNPRQRAFFVPRPDEKWGPELFRLRDQRADPDRYKEVYRVGNTS